MGAPIRSVANVTRRDALEFLELAARAGSPTDMETHPLPDANMALARLRPARSRRHGGAHRWARPTA